MRPVGCKSRTGKDWPSAGTACCVVWERSRLRSVHRGSAGHVIEPRKQIIAESTSLFERKTTGVTPQRAWCDRSAGVEEHGMSARVAQEPGRAQSFLVPDAVRAPRKKQPRPVGAVRPHGSEEDHRQGSAKRRQRSAARRRLSRRSRLIVPLSAGNSPQRTRGREAADRLRHLLEG